jgi:predicted nucleic acid-binding protein
VFVERLARNHPILRPSEKNWLECARLLSKIAVDKGFHGEKLRDLYFDLLIALTARSAGACLVTSDRADFELIASYRRVQLEI